MGWVSWAAPFSVADLQPVNSELSCHSGELKDPKSALRREPASDFPSAALARKDYAA
jgi:hypothetical protein